MPWCKLCHTAQGKRIGGSRVHNHAGKSQLPSALIHSWASILHHRLLISDKRLERRSSGEIWPDFLYFWILPRWRLGYCRRQFHRLHNQVSGHRRLSRWWFRVRTEGEEPLHWPCVCWNCHCAACTSKLHLVLQDRVAARTIFLEDIADSALAMRWIQIQGRIYGRAA